MEKRRYCSEHYLYIQTINTNQMLHPVQTQIHMALAKEDIAI